MAGAAAGQARQPIGRDLGGLEEEEVHGAGGWPAPGRESTRGWQDYSYTNPATGKVEPKVVSTEKKVGDVMLPAGASKAAKARRLVTGPSDLRAPGSPARYDYWMIPVHASVVVGTHTVSIERLERLRWRVSVDGQRLATYCTESRARSAGRQEARRLDYTLRPGGAGGRGGAA